MTRLSDVVEAARFKAETDDDFFSPEVEMSDKSLFSRLMIKKGLNFALLKSKETIWFQNTAQCLRINYYVQKIGGRRSQWNSAQMNNRHPWQLKKKSKSWGPFGATCQTALPIQPIYGKNGPKGLNWHCSLASSSKTASRILIAIGAKHSF